MDRLLSMLDRSSYDLTYQINLRRRRRSDEEERAVRKYVAASQLEPPFPMPMTNLQIAIARRLLQAAFVSDEFIAAHTDDELAAVLQAVESHFEATMGPFGFERPPIESGRFDDLLVSGLHSSCFGEQSTFLSRGAGALGLDDVRRLLASPPPTPP